MKRLLTILLSTLIVFSSCLMVSAEDNIFNAFQDSDGNLIIETNDTEIGTTVFKSIYNGMDSRLGGDGGIIWVTNGFCSGSITNMHTRAWYGEGVSKDLDEINATISDDEKKLTISKEFLTKNGFVDGTWELELVTYNGKSDNNIKYSFKCNVEIKNINAPIPEKASLLTLEGRTKSPKEGMSTDIIENDFVLKKQNGDIIDKEYYDVYWGNYYFDDNYGATLFHRTSDSTFKAGKEYYLCVDYTYALDRPLSDPFIADADLIYEYGEQVDTSIDIISYTSVGWNFMRSTDTVLIVIKADLPRVKVKTSTSNDLSKELVEKVAIKNSASEVQNLVEVSTTEQNALDSGKNLEIQMSINSQSSVSEEDVSKVETKVAADGLTKGAIYDIKMYKNIEGETEKTAVTETKVETVISFPLEDRLVNTDSSVNREYKVVRVHHDDDDESEPEVKVLDATYDASTKSITFKTDKFSTYAICYKDTKKEEKKEETNTSSNTSSTKVVTCEEAMNSKNWTWSESKKACVYRVANTSAK